MDSFGDFCQISKEWNQEAPLLGEKLLNSVAISIIDLLGLLTLNGDPRIYPNCLSSLITFFLFHRDFDQHILQYFQ